MMFHKLSKCIIVMLQLILVNTAWASDLTVINGGSKTGGVFVESQAIVDELSKRYKVDFINPGNNCVAQSLIRKHNSPVLFFWDSLHEVTGRTTNNAECQIDFRVQDVIRVDTYDWRICSISSQNDKNNLVRSRGGYKIGYGNPGSVFARNVQSINTAFGTHHTGVLYTTGIGSLITALQNREIDYAILSPRIANRAKDQGVSCHWTMHTRETSGLPSLQQAAKDPNNLGLVGIYQTLLVAKNFDSATKQQVKNLIRSGMDTPGSALYELHKGLGAAAWDRPSSQIDSEWQMSVKTNLPPQQ